MKTTVKQVFESSDGETHETLELAERCNELIAAKAMFVEAAKRVVKCLGATALTADRQPFDMKSSQTYWYIAANYPSLPRLVEVWVWPHNASIDINADTGHLMLREYSSDRGQYLTHRINEMYRSKAAAKQAHKAACEKRLAELTEEVKGLNA